MADPTYPIALAALRAECGEPTYEREAGGSHDAMWGSVVAASVELNDIFGEVWIEASDAAGATYVRRLAGEVQPPDAPLTPLADAVRDAGAWLRGRG